MKRLDRFRLDIQDARSRDARRQARLCVYWALLKRHPVARVMKHAHQVEAVLTQAERELQAPLFAGRAA